MKLKDFFLNLENYDDQATLFVQKPWSLQSAVIVIDDVEKMSIDRDGVIYQYFLEVSIINELIEDFEAENMSLEPMILGIIEYAIHDA